MSMTVLHVQNFRSIKNLSIQLAPITVVYGPNGSGKSSLLYAPLVLRNIAQNPNQSIPSLFNLGFLNMGGFKEVAFGRREDTVISLGAEGELSLPCPACRYRFSIILSKQTSAVFRFQLSWPDGSEIASAELNTSLPYGLGQQVDLNSMDLGWQLSWNGLNWSQRGPALKDNPEPIQDVLTELNRPAESLRRISVAPVTRGFFQPQYSIITPQYPFKEHELASLLATDSDLEASVSMRLEEICGRQFRVRIQPGTSVFSLQILDRSRHFVTELVNDGFGVNQLVYILALALRKETDIMLIEEPEIHLHPSMIRNFTRALAEISETGRIFLVSTHSETFVTSLLNLVSSGKLPASRISFYLTARADREEEAQFLHQEVNAEGQIEGGLKNFVDSELEDLKVFLGIQGEDSH